MYHTRPVQQQPSFACLSNHPTNLNLNPNPNSNPDPNSYYSYPHPTVHYGEPEVNPPGIDLYDKSGSCRTQYYQDPNAGSAAWVTWQAGPITYEHGSLLSTNLNSSADSYWTSQPLENSVAQSIPTQNKVIQPMRCAVCNIDCNSKDVFEKHISGKKHLKNLQNQLNPTAAALSTIDNVSMSSQELEMKRQKLLNGGAAVDSVRVCTICNIACNGQEAYNKHFFGKKHAAQASLMSLGVGECFAAIKAQNNSFWSRGQKKMKVVQSVWCEVCKINCNSNDVYVKHLQGKKHQKNLENLDKTKNSSGPSTSVATLTATIPMIGPTTKPIIGHSENPEAKTSSSVIVQKSQHRATVEDLETKKRKVVEGGAVARAVRACSICNVVCNSEIVFAYHLAGQKHAAMVKKQAEACTESAAPSFVSAT